RSASGSARAIARSSASATALSSSPASAATSIPNDRVKSRTRCWCAWTTFAPTAKHARSCGARILMEPTDFEYGERQYSAEDPAGHRWTFSETLDDVAPEAWGGTLLEPN